MKKFWYGVLAFTPLIEAIVSVVLMLVSIVLMVMAAIGSINISAAVPSVLLWISIAVISLLLCHCQCFFLFNLGTVITNRAGNIIF